MDYAVEDVIAINRRIKEIRSEEQRGGCFACDDLGWLQIYGLWMTCASCGNPQEKPRPSA